MVELNIKFNKSANNEPRGVAFSASGLKMYIGNDDQWDDDDQ